MPLLVDHAYIAVRGWRLAARVHKIMPVPIKFLEIM